MVVLPLPVGPVVRKRPCGFSTSRDSKEARSASRPSSCGLSNLEFFSSKPHHHAFAVNGRHRADADINTRTAMMDLDMAVLRHESLGDIHVGHDLDARDQRGVQLLRRRRFLLKQAVDAIA